MKKYIKQYVPAALITFIKKLAYSAKTNDPVDQQYASRDIGQIFTEVYETDEWGKGDESKYKKEGVEFYSGSGSHSEAATQYINFVSDFIKKTGTRSITDIGCGDFHIGRQICKLNPQLEYNGVDIVPSLIEYNNKTYGTDRIRFFCINTLVDKVPKSDLLLIRQVLQHLSNGDIQKLTQNVFEGHKIILVTEHQLKKAYLVKPNIDKDSGPNTRLGFGSGVYLNKPPFHYQWNCVLTVDDKDNMRCELSTYQIKK